MEQERKLTKSEKEAFNWLTERNGDGVFDKTGVLLAAGELAPFMRRTWNGLRRCGYVEFYKPKGTTTRVRIKRTAE